MRELGVTTDLAQGNNYLQKAAAQGHQGAGQQLAALSVGNHPTSVYCTLAKLKNLIKRLGADSLILNKR